LYLAGNPGSTVVIENIEVVVHEDDQRPLAWAIEPETGCGGGDVDVRLYSVYLDRPAPRLVLGTVNNIERDDRTAFSPFEASARDPTVVMIEAQKCSGYAEWGVLITYSISGRQYERLVGGKSEPLRIAAGPAELLFGEVYTENGSSWEGREAAGLKAC
jgi:hypothetical protein